VARQLCSVACGLEQEQRQYGRQTHKFCAHEPLFASLDWKLAEL